MSLLNCYENDSKNDSEATTTPLATTTTTTNITTTKSTTRTTTPITTETSTVKTMLTTATMPQIHFLYHFIPDFSKEYDIILITFDKTLLYVIKLAESTDINALKLSWLDYL